MPKNNIIIHPYYFSTRKRLYDLVVSLFSLAILSPIIIFIAILTKLSSRGPVMFTQKRAGLFGKPFLMYKFRTMYVGADKDQKKYQKLNTSPFPTFKIKDDPRFVGIGRWLSRSSLDELPQLFNVLLGNMSLVGPRPLPVNENKLLPPYWRFRTRVKPGIFSGWIFFNRQKLTSQKWAKFDLADLHSGGIIHDITLMTRVIRQLI